MNNYLFLIIIYNLIIVDSQSKGFFFGGSGSGGNNPFDQLTSQLSALFQGGAQSAQSFCDEANDGQARNNFGDAIVDENCRSESLDLLFIVDGSGSVGPSNFEKVKNFAKLIVDTTKVGRDNSRIGFVQFSSKPKTEFSFNRYTSSQDVNEAIDRIAIMQGGTNAGLALQHAMEKELISSAGDRPDVKTVVIIMTDGASSDDPKPAAEEMRRRGFSTIVIGIEGAQNPLSFRFTFGRSRGSGGSSLNSDQMLNMAGSPDRVFKVCDFNRLDSEVTNAIATQICSEGETCKRNFSDFMFLVDSSGSIGSENFQKIKDFLKLIVDTLEVGQDQSRVGLVQFSDGEPRSEFSLSSYNSKEAVMSAIDSINWIRGKTEIGRAISYLQNFELIQSKGHRTNVPTSVLVITDGRSSDNVKDPADRLRNSGVSTFALGVTDEIDRVQLRDIAGDNSRQFLVQNFNKLNRRLKNSITSKICGEKKRKVDKEEETDTEEFTPEPWSTWSVDTRAPRSWTSWSVNIRTPRTWTSWSVNIRTPRPWTSWSVNIRTSNPWASWSISTRRTRRPIGVTGPDRRNRGHRQGTCSSEMDLVFVVDGSSSIRGDNFNKIKQFLKDILSSVDVGRTQVAIVQFNDNPKTEFYLNQYKNERELIEAIDNIQWMRGETSIGKALEEVQKKVLKRRNGWRKNVETVVVVFTDGRSNDDVERATTGLKRGKSVKMLAVGITDRVDQSQLRLIAGSDQRIYLVEDFDKLNQQLHIRISEEICGYRPSVDNSDEPGRREPNHPRGTEKKNKGRRGIIRRLGGKCPIDVAIAVDQTLDITPEVKDNIKQALSILKSADSSFSVLRINNRGDGEPLHRFEDFQSEAIINEIIASSRKPKFTPIKQSWPEFLADLEGRDEARGLAILYMVGDQVLSDRLAEDFRYLEQIDIPIIPIAQYRNAMLNPAVRRQLDSIVGPTQAIYDKPSGRGIVAALYSATGCSQ